MSQDLQKEKEKLEGAQAALEQAKADAATAQEEAERLGPAQARILELEGGVEHLRDQLACAQAVSNLLPGLALASHCAVQLHTYFDVRLLPFL